MTKLRDVVEVLDEAYDPRWAEDWDAVGTVAGDPDAPVRRILLAVDPVQQVADEAVHLEADLLVTHHPLFLRGTTTVAASTPKGRIVHTLLRNDVALHTCHTNADVPELGVSESMAFALGLSDVRPLLPAGQDGSEAMDKWIVFVPVDDTDTVAEGLWAAGAGKLGEYTRASFRSAGTGTFLPSADADPAIGSAGADEHVAETRLEVVAPRARREDIRAALLAAHPYEEPAYDVFESAARAASDDPGRVHRGHGRIGRLPEPMTLHDFVVMVREALPAHHGGIRVAGSPDQQIRTVALCGGAGDFLLDRAQQTGADVYVTSDLRHHPVSEHREGAEACAVVDVAHWAAEWTWLPVAAHLLQDRLGDSVEIHISSTVTDPWSFTLAADLESRSAR